MEATYQFNNVNIKIIDNSKEEEKRKKLEQALINFIERAEYEKKKIKEAV